MASNNFTQVRIRREYLEKLRKLSYANKRSMMRMLEVLIDRELAPQQGANTMPSDRRVTQREQPLSTCHNAPMTVGGKDTEGSTRYFICTVCGQPADIAVGGEGE